MFKKGFALFLISLLVMTTAVVWADAELTAEVEFVRETTLTTVSGSAPAAEGTRAHLLVLKPGYSFEKLKPAQLEAALCRADETTVLADGSFAFTPFVMSSTLEIGEFSWRVSVGGAAVTGSTYYAPLAKVIEILNNFDAAAASDVYGYLITQGFASSLGLDEETLTVYKALTKDAQGERGFVDSALASGDYSVALTATEAEVESKLALLSEDFDKLVALGCINDAEEAEDIAAALELYNSVYGVDTTFSGVFDAFTEDDKENAVEALYQKAADRERFALAADIAPYFASQAVLVAVEESKWSVLESVLVEHSDALGLDLTAYNALSTYKKDQVMKALAGATGITDGAVLQSKLDAAIKAAGRTTDGGGGSNGSGKKNTAGSGLLIDYVNAPEASGSTNNQIFSDISHVAWAEESILALYNRGIINGKEPGKFYPNDTVTRAEFVKMLVLAFGQDASEAAVSFNDVSAGAWYTSYIAKAVQMSLVEGYADGNFGVNDTITRQDMAALLYRLIASRGVSEKTGTAFNDTGAVAEYAKKAVSVLSAYDIFSGDENGNFRPQDYASRAEAAKVIYAVTNLLP